MIYHKFRCDRIEEQFWKFGGDLHHQEKHNLSEGEKNYFNAYKDIAVAYGEKVGMDLTLDLDPPLELQV